MAAPLDVEAATRARAREAIAELEALLSKWVPELEGAPRTRKIFLELRNSSARILDHHPDYQEDGACPDPAWPPLRVIDGGRALMAAPRDDEGVTQEQREAARRIILGLRDAVTRLQGLIEQGRREPKGGG